MGDQTDMFAKVDENEGRERFLAADLSVLLTTRVGLALEPGELREAATDLSRKVAALAKERFVSEDDDRERLFALEVALVLVARLDRPLSDVEAQSASADLGRKLAALARKRFSHSFSKLKKST